MKFNEIHPPRAVASDRKSHCTQKTAPFLSTPRTIAIRLHSARSWRTISVAGPPPRQLRRCPRHGPRPGARRGNAGNRSYHEWEHNSGRAAVPSGRANPGHGHGPMTWTARRHVVTTTETRRNRGPGNCQKSEDLSIRILVFEAGGRPTLFSRDV